MKYFPEKDLSIIRNCSLIITFVLFCISVSFADEIYSKNQKANRLYKQNKYEEALKIYNDALLLSPSDPALKMNKGAVLYKLHDYDKAEEFYNSALSMEDKKKKADAHYNLGNILFREGEQMQKSGNPSANDKYKAALQNYIQALDYHPGDRDAKWNLQLTHQRIKQLEQQSQNQQNQNKNQNDKNKDNQNKQNDQNKKNDQQQNQQQNKNDNQKQNKNDQSNENKKQNEQQQQNQSQEQKNQDDMKKEDAKRLIEFYADDADSLNKPKQKIGAAHPVYPQHDW